MAQDNRLPDKIRIIRREIGKRDWDGQVGSIYTEKQVNEILSGFHQDSATLRRELVGRKLLEREGGGGEYWRV